jgi:hypothetical protein
MGGVQGRILKVRDNRIFIQCAKLFCSGQWVDVESRNGAIAKALMKKELLTGNMNIKWVEFLPLTISYINKHLGTLTLSGRQ